MTGKDLIEFIQANNAQDLEIMLLDIESGWDCEKYKATEIEVEENEQGKIVVVY